MKLKMRPLCSLAAMILTFELRRIIALDVASPSMMGIMMSVNTSAIS